MMVIARRPFDQVDAVVSGEFGDDVAGNAGLVGDLAQSFAFRDIFAAQDCRGEHLAGVLAALPGGWARGGGPVGGDAFERESNVVAGGVQMVGRDTNRLQAMDDDALDRVEVDVVRVASW